MSVRTVSRAVLMFVWLGLLGNPAVAAIENSFDPALAELGWKELILPGKSPNSFHRIGDTTIEVSSSSSVSVLYRTLKTKEKGARTLSWRWRVDKSVPATDPAEEGADDRDLAVHVWFADENESFWHTLKSTVTRAIGFPQIGKVLTYTFGGTGDRLRRLVNPHHDPDGVIIILRPSGTPLETWFSERVDFLSDYELAFGQIPDSPMYLAISSDSDDTKTTALALISDLSFEAPKGLRQ